MYRWLVNTVLLYILLGLKFLLIKTLLQCSLPSFFIGFFLKADLYPFLFFLQVKRRILTGTYALSAGYYDAYYKRAQQVP